MKRKDLKGDLGLDGRVIWKWVSSVMWPCGLDSLGMGSIAGFCERGNEHTVSIKGGKFLPSWNTISFSKITLAWDSLLCSIVRTSVNWSRIVASSLCFVEEDTTLQDQTADGIGLSVLDLNVSKSMHNNNGFSLAIKIIPRIYFSFMSLQNSFLVSTVSIVSYSFFVVYSSRFLYEINFHWNCFTALQDLWIGRRFFNDSVWEDGRGLFQRTILELLWKDWGILQKTLSPCVPSQILNPALPKYKQAACSHLWFFLWIPTLEF